MTIPKLEGFDESIGPSLASLTDTIGSLVKPTAKYDQALKALFIEKPEMMQKFVDIEKQNPGTLKAFGFGEGATDFLTGMRESIPSIRMGLGRETLEQSQGARETAGQQEATGETPAQASGAALQRYMLEGGLELAKSDPQAFDAAIRNILKVPSKHELNVQQDVEGVYQGGKKLADMGIPEIVTGIQSGTIKNEDINAGLMHPAAAAGVKAALGQYQFEREAALRRELAQTAVEGRTHGGSNALETSLRRAAYDQFKAAGGVAPIGAFYEVMWGEPYKGVAAPSEQIKAVESWLKTSQADKGVKRKAEMLKTIRPLFDQTIRRKNQRPPTDELVRGNILKINEVLEQSGSAWRAEYDKTGHWWQTKVPQIVFRDKQGNISKDATPLFSEIPAETVRASDDPPPLNQYERQILSQLEALDSAGYEAGIQQLRDAGTDPDVIQRIIDNTPAY